MRILKRLFVKIIDNNLVFAVGFLVVMLILNAFFIVNAISTLKTEENISADMIELKEDMSGIPDLIQGVDLGLRGYFIAGHEKLLAPLEKSNQTHDMVYNKILNTFQKYEIDHQKLLELKEETAKYLKNSQSLITRIDNGDKEYVQYIIKTDPGNEIGLKYEEFYAPVSETISYHVEQSRSNFSSILNNFILIQGILLLIGIPLLAFVVRKIRQKDKIRIQLFKNIQTSNEKYVYYDQNIISDSESKIIENLTNNLKEATNFINEISKGNYETQWKGMTSEIRQKNKHNLAGELINMQEKMKQVKKEDEIRMWGTEGLAKFAGIVRKDFKDLSEMADQIISNIVKYIGGNQGGLFLVNDDNEDDIFITLMGCYAYDRKRYQDKTIKPGQGLIGQTYKEGTTLNLKEIPENYVNITSGLGEATPTNLVVVPLIVNEKIIGLLEIASFKGFEEQEIQFLEKVGEIIASSVNTIKTSDKTKEILEISQSQAEEMQAQEEEMRQNMEEMEATQEEMARTQRELGEKEMNLKALINSTDDAIITVNKDYKVLVINDNAKERYESSRQSKIKEGVNFLDFLGSEKEEWKGYYDQALQGESLNFTRKSKTDREENWRDYFINPVSSTDGQIIGVSIISRDVTNRILAQQNLAFEKSLFTALMGSSPDSIYYKDLESKFIRVSESMVKHMGKSAADELIGKSDFDFFDDEHAKPAYNDEMNIIKTDKPIVGLVEKEVHNNGEVTWVETSKMPLKNEDGEIMGTFGVSKNITETKNAEIEANKNKKILINVVNNSSNSYLVVDPEFNIIIINETLKKLFKQQGIELSNEINFIKSLPSANQVKWNKRFDEIKNGKVIDEEEEINFGGISQLLNIQGRSIKDEDGKVIGLSIMLQNLTQSEKA